MGTHKLVREFKRKAKASGYRIDNIMHDAGHLHAVVMHGDVPQRITLPSSPASPEQSIKHALDEIRRFKTAHETTTQHDMRLHGSGGQEDAHSQEAGASHGAQEEVHAPRGTARRRASTPRR